MTATAAASHQRMRRGAQFVEHFLGKVCVAWVLHSDGAWELVRGAVLLGVKFSLVDPPIAST